jgi:hypothetical protein
LICVDWLNAKTFYVKISRSRLSRLHAFQMNSSWLLDQPAQPENFSSSILQLFFGKIPAIETKYIK